MADSKHGKVDLPCGLTHGSKNDCAKVTFQISDNPLVTRGDSHARLCLVLQQVLLGVQLREQASAAASSDGGVQPCDAGSSSRLPCYAS